MLTWDFAGGVILPLVVAIILGAAGWFLLSPLAEFKKLRVDVHEALFYTANISHLSPPEEIKEAGNGLRRLAARLDALADYSPRLASNFLRSRGFDLKKGSEGLVGLSNSIGVDRGLGGVIHRDKVEKGLKFKRSYTDELVKTVISNL